MIDTSTPTLELTQCSSGTKTWNNHSQSGDGLTCNGDNSLTCTMPVTASYDTSGNYTCNGYNKNSTNTVKTNSDTFRLTTGNRQISLAHFLNVFNNNNNNKRRFYIAHQQQVPTSKWAPVRDICAY